MTAPLHTSSINPTISILTHASMITIHCYPCCTFTSITSTWFTLKKLLILTSNAVHIFTFYFLAFHCVHIQIKAKQTVTTRMLTSIITFYVNSIWPAFKSTSVRSVSPKLILSTSCKSLKSSKGTKTFTFTIRTHHELHLHHIH